MIMGHWLVLRSHDQWRKGHQFHAEVTPRREALVKMGVLRCLGGRMEPVIPVVPVANPSRRRRGVKVQDEQDGDGHVRAEPGDTAGGEDR
jgi:hypothetical protein